MGGILTGLEAASLLGFPWSVFSSVPLLNIGRAYGPAAPPDHQVRSLRELHLVTPERFRVRLAAT